jgi:DNA gyrase/topoisomerase IV subunit A
MVDEINSWQPLSEPVAAAMRQVPRHLFVPDATLEELTEFVPGPDLPTGGTIVGLEGLRDAYAKGRGTFRTISAEVIELKEDMAVALNALTDTMDTASRLMVDVGRDVSVITALPADHTATECANFVPTLGVAAIHAAWSHPDAPPGGQHS